MLSLTIGILLLIGGATGRIALVGSRVNAVLAAVGAVFSVIGLSRLVRQRPPEPVTECNAIQP